MLVLRAGRSKDNPILNQSEDRIHLSIHRDLAEKAGTSAKT